MAPSTSAKPAPDQASEANQQRQTQSYLHSLFASPTQVYFAAFFLRAILLLYGLYQDAVSPVKYTDIDYMVFTDAARLSAASRSPYARETYRYTPLLAWLLLPTAWSTTASSPLAATALFSFGKVLFSAADLLAGWLLEQILLSSHGRDGAGDASVMTPSRARLFAAIWLLNPMVATISTRGSSEGVLGVLVAALLWAALKRRAVLTGLLLGFGVHFKIYPFIYAPAIVWWMDEVPLQLTIKGKTVVVQGRGGLAGFITWERILLFVSSITTFGVLNGWMYALYGQEFVQHTFLHHVSRLDHRHNFSPYNTLLYMASSANVTAGKMSTETPTGTEVGIESLAFLPQLLLSTVVIPLVLAKKSLEGTMLAQTFAFVAFNKVCTSQYFLWHMVLLPLYLPHSTFLRQKALGVGTLAAWIATQALWLQQGFELEFVGKSTFVPGLWAASLSFFSVNCWILGVIIEDVGNG